MKLLIDGDALVYPILESNRHEEGDDEVLWAYISIEVCMEAAEKEIGRYMEWAKAKEVMIAFSCPSAECFRKQIAPTYKANRKARKPMGFTPFRTALSKVYETQIYPGLEADDILGILQTIDGSDTCIVGVDKDFLTIPGKIMDPRSGEIVTVSGQGADQQHLRQTLLGDPSDGYPGCPGYGPKSIEKLGPLTWKKVVACFGGDEEAALVQARLARILRASDWDFKTKTPILWTPR